MASLTTHPTCGSLRARSRGPLGLRRWSTSHTVWAQCIGARGVIIGWDERTKAPRQWIAGNLPGERSWTDMLRRLYAPHYSVLEERRMDDGKLKFMQRYIVAHCREDAEPCMRVESPAAPLQHPDTQKYFAGFDPERGYLPNAALEELYPDG